MNENGKCKSGVPGLDEILSGGFPENHLYLIQGKPGTGKTTLSLQFLIEGARRKERVLYVTFSETKAELSNVAASHGWSLENIDILELSSFSQKFSESNQTLFHPSEVELTNTINLLFKKLDEVRPARIVFDSVSELRLLADTSLRYRRQMLAFKEYFVGRGATILFLDDLTTEAGDVHVQSIVHGVMQLEKFRAAYGTERRQFHIVKLRGVKFRGGTHDYIIETGGLRIFPRLVAADHLEGFTDMSVSSGVEKLDLLLGGGLDRGTSNLILGPAGTGKSTIATRFALSAAERGQRVSIFSFEESNANFIKRATALGMNVKKYLNNGLINLRKIDPAELTPGQFADLLRRSSTEDNVDMVIIDSLNGYLHAMPEQQFLILQLHELLTFLGNRGVVTLMILAQAGIMGTMQTPLDLTYLADTVLVTRYFEAGGAIRKAISALKKRTGIHEESLRELSVGQGGIIVGEVLKNFRGVFTGVPTYVRALPQDYENDA